MTLMIFEWTVRSSVLALAVWLALKSLRINNPRLERGAWRAVLATSLSMPLLMKLAALSPAHTPVFNVQEVGLAPLPIESATVTSYSAVALIAIALVSAALIIRQSWGTARWWNVRRLAKPISPGIHAGLDVRTSAAVSSPATVFSTVLVPIDFESWTAEARHLALAHERAHIVGKDFYVQWLAHFHRNLFWFNPLSWWLASRLSLLSEHISDDAATEHVEERTAYARLLLSVVQRARAGSQLVPMVRASSLDTRIERILSEQQPARTSWSKILLLACALLPIISTVAAVQTGTPTSDDQTGRSLLLPASSNAQIVLPRSNPLKPLSRPAYPSASRRIGEHGTVVLKLHVLEDGSVADAVIDRSSGYPDLDYAALYESFRWQLEPGTVNGAPSRMWGQFAVTFKLPGDELASARQ